MPVFFSKKQKAEFRKRRQRLKEAEKKNGVQETTNAEDALSTVTVEEASEPQQEENQKLIIIPKGLGPKEAKKFRKDARRKAKAEGKDPSELEFLVEGTKPKDSAEPGTKKKKRKRDFPCLNELLAEENNAKAKKQEEEARKVAEAALSDEYKSRYLAVDCEMVGIGTDGKKSALARVSIVDWDGKCVFDTFVQVPTKVTDFRTHVSGITPKDIKSKAGAMKESECREKVAKLLQGKILVGHALKNDLHALLLTHPKANIRDTAKYQPFQRLGGTKWRPRKLRDLAKEHLGIIIQQEGDSHDSTEDAWAAMQLFRLVREKWEQDLEEKFSKRRKL